MVDLAAKLVVLQGVAQQLTALLENQRAARGARPPAHNSAHQAAKPRWYACDARRPQAVCTGNSCNSSRPHAGGGGAVASPLMCSGLAELTLSKACSAGGSAPV